MYNNSAQATNEDYLQKEAIYRANAIGSATVGSGGCLTGAQAANTVRQPQAFEIIGRELQDILEIATGIAVNQSEQICRMFGPRPKQEANSNPQINQSSVQAIGAVLQKVKEMLFEIRSNQNELEKIG